MRLFPEGQAKLDVDVTPGVHWLVVDSTSGEEAGRYGLTALLR